MIRTWKIVFSFVCFLSLIVFFAFVHELSHIIVALCFGNRILGFGLYFKDGVIDITKLSVFCNVELINPNSRVPILIAGSLGNVIVCSICFLFSIKKRILVLFFSSITMIFVELFYWIFSPIVKFGDAYNTYELLGIKNYFLFSIIFFSIFIVFLLIFATRLERILVRDDCLNSEDKRIIKEWLNSNLEVIQNET